MTCIKQCFSTVVHTVAENHRVRHTGTVSLPRQQQPHEEPAAVNPADGQVLGKPYLLSAPMFVCYECFDFWRATLRIVPGNDPRSQPRLMYSQRSHQDLPTEPMHFSTCEEYERSVQNRSVVPVPTVTGSGIAD